MISREVFWEIVRLHKVEKMSSTQIGGKLGLSPRTVRRYMRQDSYPEASGNRNRQSRAAACEEQARLLLAQHPYTVTQLHARLTEEGAACSYRTLARLVQKIRPRHAEAVMKLHFEPGEAAEVDFGACGVIACGQTQRRLSVCAVVLCHSRMLYAEFIPCERLEHFLSCQQRALQFFGGSPRRMIVDNCRCAVTRHPRVGEVTYNPTFLDFCGHHGMRPTACRPRHPQSKGIVERAIGYIKHNFVDGRRFASLEQANAALRNWLEQIANVRRHGTTEKRPCDLLVEERPHLLPLPPMPYECARVESRCVDRFGRVHFDQNTYSVPERLVGRLLVIKATTDKVSIFHETSLVTSHARSYDRNQEIILSEHTEEVRLRARAARMQNLRQDFLNLTPAAADFLRKLEDETLNSREHLIRIMALEEIGGREALVEAINTALHFQVCKSEYVEHLILTRAQKPPRWRGVLHVPKANGQLDIQLPTPDLQRFKVSWEGSHE